MYHNTHGELVTGNERINTGGNARITFAAPPRTFKRVKASLLKGATTGTRFSCGKN